MTRRHINSKSIVVRTWNFASSTRRIKAVLSIRIRIDIGQMDPYPHWEFGSGSRRAKITPKKEEISEEM
jgi:hypothetical protein